MFECPFACYLFADAQIEPYFQMGANFNVGSTTASLQKRQDDRIHKYRQLVALKPVHAELMLHWAVSRQCLGLWGSCCQDGHNQANSHIGVHFDSKVESTFELSFHLEKAFDKSRT